MRLPRAAGAAAVLAAAALWGSTGTTAHFAPAGATAVSVGAARIVVGGALLALIGLVRPGRSGTRSGTTPPGRPETSGRAPSPGRPEAPGRTGSYGGARTSGAGPRDWRWLVTGGRLYPALLALGGASVAGYQLAFFSAVRLTGVAIGTVVAIGSAPVFTGLISRIATGAVLGSRWLAATAGAIAGCAVLVTGGRAAGVSLPGLGLAMLAGLCYATYAVTAAGLIAGGRPERAVMGALFGVGGLLLLPVLLATSPGWLGTARGLAVTAELAVLATVAAYLLYGRGLRTVPAPAAATLGLAEPVVAALLALLVLGERLTGVAVTGLALVCLALAVLVIRRPGWPAAAQSAALPPAAVESPSGHGDG